MRLKSVEDSLFHSPNTAKFEGDSLRANMDITSAQAGMMRLKGQVIKTTEDFNATKTEVSNNIMGT